MLKSFVLILFAIGTFLFLAMVSALLVGIGLANQALKDLDKSTSPIPEARKRVSGAGPAS